MELRHIRHYVICRLSHWREEAIARRFDLAGQKNAVKRTSKLYDFNTTDVYLFERVVHPSDNLSPNKKSHPLNFHLVLSVYS